MSHMETNTTDTEAADIAAIEKVVAEVERAQRAKDVEGFLALFHPEALWTTGHGKVLIGLDAIAEFTRAVLPAASWDGEVSYEPVHIQFLRPDVAAVKVRQVYRSVDGDSEGAPLYVMSRRGDGVWLLHACQNTEVKAD
ncbi:SgcJ/EcaC family oxidoreductase [Streptomyces sp. LBUM 1476]|uniref:SgcJ/EcaC family oxidoreductase n=2 Tax=Streptomyces acidiscabies TaxID=42234 RepID=A0AAP6BBC8_9ACTN|nr:SgcJ/EcaC family oxidoreductase [Streptomyces acidiscabies]MBP5938068.1 SgcJ/EcaC family oxidoreductase [Streptomyces sp. LBUM 1476]MBZ3909077.1 SgcJ/EcaC family oxidoreductase [Streptomyces acidiscabies]MDX2961616.1 SgcJ/EcaC family oxidoreductase [Streptomyces acidiscabies]MDX3016516.1 SgcJ/EcaC family oxidoreductase [Streptomyces acidiscabies]MDX3788579.1 SgcJ/EcaC family oxidoreductase [Streptomyces acidiscabies]